jgi:FdhD protein
VVRAIRIGPDHHVELPEHLATEEPLEIRVAGPGQEPVPVAVTMRTPGHDFELAAGFLVTEALVRPLEILNVGYCEAIHDDAGRYNTVTVTLTRPWLPVGPARAFVASASCGTCGKASIDQVQLDCPVVPPATPVPASLLPQLPDRLRRSQQVFARTGGLHAAGLFDPEGNATCVREDIGRHNAVDKVAGHTILGSCAGNNRQAGFPALARWVLLVSGRVSFEIVQKAALCGIGIIAAVSAPSSLAVQAGDRLGVTVAGFVRGGTYNLYSHPERVALDS